MKIQNEQLQALQQQVEARAKPRAAEGMFDAIFADQLGQAQASGSVAAGQIPGPVPVLGVDSLAGIAKTPEATMLDMVANSIDGMLGDLDEYAQVIGSQQGADLRKAYGILQGMDKNLASLRDTTPDLAARHAGMASLVDEISVITRAETVKLNRGDYI